MPPLEAADGIAAERYHRMLRVHADGEGKSYAVAEIFLDRARYDQAPQRYDREMVLSVLEETAGPELATMKQRFTLTAADSRVGQLLGLNPGDPLGRLRRVLLGRDNRIIYFSLTLVRADRIAFEWVLQRPDQAGTGGNTYSGYLDSARPGADES